ncbi:twin-arginine translocation signal domain-containing protein [Azospirillum formosense]|uniref:Twin-arginine translocation signal domain-containing protein n=1 Tax=Azospirillum formosense TaxID=861533 RepID=A0ABX2KX18_9PROT|nr:twin-arginine translocation signal domain-containing protein [Azospirillum formosense]MBY3754670.1 twin-arginine translocation signal domain-containing protein [Azospirillum formosense]NUB21189.1 twin-arginine translocation signal domain-containing protein [Azospirillum formosense]
MHRDDSQKKAGLERRSLLKGLGLGAAGAAAAAATLRAAPAEAMDPGPEQMKSLYRDNDHVKRFYALNRL